MKRLIAKITGWKLAIVEHGFDNHLRFVHETAEGKMYVRLYGRYTFLNPGGRYWVPLNFRREDCVNSRQD